MNRMIAAGALLSILAGFVRPVFAGEIGPEMVVFVVDGVDFAKPAVARLPDHDWMGKLMTAAGHWYASCGSEPSPSGLQCGMGRTMDEAEAFFDRSAQSVGSSVFFLTDAPKPPEARRAALLLAFYSSAVKAVEKDDAKLELLRRDLAVARRRCEDVNRSSAQPALNCALEP